MNNLTEITARMLEIETINMKYNKDTNFGQKENGRENEILCLLEERDKLKAMRQDLKNGDTIVKKKVIDYSDSHPGYYDEFPDAYGQYL